jgi:hypothetical protein
VAVFRHGQPGEGRALLATLLIAGMVCAAALELRARPHKRADAQESAES